MGGVICVLGLADAIRWLRPSQAPCVQTNASQQGLSWIAPAVTWWWCGYTAWPLALHFWRRCLEGDSAHWLNLAGSIVWRKHRLWLLVWIWTLDITAVISCSSFLLCLMTYAATVKPWQELWPSAFMSLDACHATTSSLTTHVLATRTSCYSSGSSIWFA